MDDFSFLDCFLYFKRRFRIIIDPKQSILFRKFIRLGSFSRCWRFANVTLCPKGAPYPDRENYRPISIASILSKVFEKLVSHKLSIFCEKYGLLPAAGFAYTKGLGYTDTLLTVFNHLQKSLHAGMESYIVQLDFLCSLR